MSCGTYLNLAAWWKNAAQMHFLITSQSVPALKLSSNVINFKILHIQYSNNVLIDTYIFNIL
jgi:hypothetical protein